MIFLLNAEKQMGGQDGLPSRQSSGLSRRMRRREGRGQVWPNFTTLRWRAASRMRDDGRPRRPPIPTVRWTVPAHEVPGRGEARMASGLPEERADRVRRGGRAIERPDRFFHPIDRLRGCHELTDDPREI